MLILLYSNDKKAYLGFIPNDQAQFVDRIRMVIQQQKSKQAMVSNQALEIYICNWLNWKGDKFASIIHPGRWGNKNSNKLGQGSLWVSSQAYSSRGWYSQEWVLK